jgi:hypothetical protein
MRRVLLSPDFGALQMIPIPAVAIVLHPHLASVRVRKVRRYAVGDGGAESWTSPNLPAETFSPRHSIMDLPPLLDNKHWGSPSVFAPSALLREARRQKGLPATAAPAVCILDPDGDLVRRLRGSGAAKPLQDWPCYHTEARRLHAGRA